MERRTRIIARSEGFTLLEMLAVVALLGILAVFATVSLRPTIDQEGPKGLVYALASEIRAARAEAQKSGQLVAFCFPSDKKTNSLSRSAVIRRGLQKGVVWRTLSFNNEYKATIFLGTWPGAEIRSDVVPPTWSTSVNDEIAIFFRPDGTAFSNDLPSVEGNLPILVASGYTGTFSGPDGTLTGAKNPQTIWVNASGSVVVEPNKVPVGTLSPAGETKLKVASLDLKPLPPGAPVITRPAVLYPKELDTEDGTGLGQSFVQLHPFQKQGKQLEYGLATIEVEATDSDGGPLTYVLSSKIASGGGGLGEGAFSVPNLSGPMTYSRDSKTGQYRWRAVVSWSPPPGAPTDSIYNLTLTVRDPDGNEDSVSTGAGLPAITSLPPARIAMVTGGQKMYLTYLDGGGEVHVNPGENDIMPFFSRDGSRIFSFHPDSDGGHTLRSRLANGTTTFQSLTTIAGNPADVWIDPTNCFAMLTENTTQQNFPWGQIVVVSEGGGSDGGGGSRQELRTGSKSRWIQSLIIVNLMTHQSLTLTDHAKADHFNWAANHNSLLSYVDVLETPERELFANGVSQGMHNESPGFNELTRKKRLSGNPFAAVDSSLAVESAKNRRYNPGNFNWYATVEDGKLLVRKNSGAGEIVVDSGSFESSPWGDKNPTWSANGQHLAFIKSPGTNASVKSYRIFNGAGAPLSAPELTFEKKNVGGASLAQLDPEGKWVYYLKDGHVYRSINDPDKMKTRDISQHINGTVRDYVISP